MVALTAKAEAVELCGDKFQGEIFKGKANQTDIVYFDGQLLPMSDNGEFIFALDRDAKSVQQLTLNGEVFDFTIAPQKWDVQNIKGLPQKKVTPSEADQKAIDRERNEIRGSQKKSAFQDFWKQGFIQPVEGRISGKFGGQRIMNNVPRNPHLGTDIAAPEGTNIKASADGIVTLAGFDYFYSGNVVVIDHGFGLYTIYAHMKNISVKKGDKLAQGDIIGTVGKTGRATGAHLHWGASLNGTRFDPFSLLDMHNAKLCFTL